MKKILLTLAGLTVIIVAGLYIRQVIAETIEPRVVGQRSVVVLGDSVAAGAGLRDGARSFDCDVNDAAFPFVLGKALQLPVEQYACSGATVAPTAGKATNTVLDQFQAAQASMPGSDVVVNAGANDTGWLQLIVSCAGEDCATDKNRNALEATLPALQRNLAKLLDMIQQTKPRAVVINTYYELLNPGDTCFERVGVTAAEASFIHEEAGKLNAAIAAAAKASGTPLVTVDFNGHLLCDKQPWIQDASGKAPLHPTAAGQQQIAAQDAQALRAAALAAE